MERLAKEKIAAQQKILLLKRELSAQWDHFDFSTIIPENEVVNVREKGRNNFNFNLSISVSICFNIQFYVIYYNQMCS